MHNAKVATYKLEGENLRRIPHMPYSPDISPCDFFLFGYLKDRLIDRRYATPEELFCEVEMIIPERVSDQISRVFQTWQEGLQKCCDMRGNDIEQVLHFA
jgi:hypothetical protein